MGVVSGSHCCMATAKHIRGNKMGKHFIDFDDWHFSGGNGVDTLAFQGVDDKYGC